MALVGGGVTGFEMKPVVVVEPADWLAIGTDLVDDLASLIIGSDGLKEKEVEEVAELKGLFRRFDEQATKQAIDKKKMIRRNIVAS